MARAKIALLYVGGSIGMKVNKKTGRIEPITSLQEIHRFLPELQADVSLEFFSVTNVGSSDITPDHWVEIATKIKQVYNKFDGFVVVHGTHTMSYTASALSFALQGLSKPVVLTGALLPINDITGDGRMNLTFAIRAAQLDIAEVCVVLGPQVLRGTRAKNVERSYLQTFQSPKIAPLADFSTTVSLHKDRTVRRKRALQCVPQFDPNIVQITMHPGVNNAYLDALLDAKPHGIILRAYGPGMLPDTLTPWLQKVTVANIPIVITSQLFRGRIDLHCYRKQLNLQELGVISGKDMLLECATVKLMWGLTQKKTMHQLRDFMEKSIVGELTE